MDTTFFGFFRFIHCCGDALPFVPRTFVWDVLAVDF